MRVRNLTPHSQIVHANEDARRRLFHILIVKASYALGEDLRLRPASPQEPLGFTDACFGAVNVSSLRQPSDLVPYKPATDVVVLADAHAPGGQARRSWECGITVEGEGGRAERTLRVHGPRFWVPRWMPGTPKALREGSGKAGPMFLGWSLGEAEPAVRVPIRYELAYGGVRPQADGGAWTEQRNPIGCGMIDREASPRNAPLPAPQVEEPDHPAKDPYSAMEPAGLGPIPPAWLPRRPLGGTYDERWRREVWPHWAEDYRFEYHQSAARGLVWDGFATGREMVELRRLRPEAEMVRFELPGQDVFTRHRLRDGSERHVAMNLDTIYLDLAPDRLEDCLVALTWRQAFLGAEVEEIEIDGTAVANPERLLGPERVLEPAPHPHDLFEVREAAELAHV